MISKKCFVFFSTLEHLPWGGCEDLWYKTALKTLEKKNDVCVIVFKHEVIPNHIVKLEEKGAKIFYLERPGKRKSLLWKLKNKIGKINLYKNVLKQIDDYLKPFAQVSMLISQAGGFDFAYSYLDNIGNWLLLNEFSYTIVVQNVPDLGVVFSLEEAQKQINIYEKSKAIGFVSYRNLISSQRILATNIKNTFIINNPLNFTEHPTYIAYPKSNDVVNFGVVAALRCFHKGQDVLLQALSSNVWKDRNWVLNFYGEGPDTDYLKKLVSYYELHDKVNFCGHTKDVMGIWEKNHIHILPSLGEGTPLALIESMYCGRAAITTNVGGNADYVVHLENGFVTYYPTLPALTAILEMAWQQKADWEQMGILARKKINDTYDLVPEIDLFNLLND